MRAAVLHEYHVPPRLEEVSVEEPREQEVLVRIAASGICASDLHVIHHVAKLGDILPIVLGHEGAGVVEATGPGVTDLKRGDRVIVNMGAPCGHCGYCGTGRAEFCDGNPPMSTFGQMDDGGYRLSQGGRTVHSFVGIGSFGEYAVVRRRKLTRIEFDAPFESMALVSCGVTTGLGAVFNVADVRSGESVLVFGCGGVGLTIVQGARIAGAATIIAVDSNPAKLDQASNLGATHGLVAPEDPKQLAAEVRRIAPRGVGYAFDAVGVRPERLAELMAATDLGGLTLVVGTLAWTDVIPLVAGDVFMGAKRLAGVRGGNSYPSRDTPRILDLYRSGQLKLDELVGSTYPLEKIGKALATAERAEHGRTVVHVAPSLL